MTTRNHERNFLIKNYLFSRKKDVSKEASEAKTGTVCFFGVSRACLEVD